MNRSPALLTALALLTLGSTAEAKIVTLVGTIAQDDDAARITFTTDSADPVTLHSFGYAGGILGNEAVQPRGGFDPIFTLYNAAGQRLVGSDDGLQGQVSADPFTGAYRDSFLSLDLEAGSYTLLITQAPNVPGFSLNGPLALAGLGNFTATNAECTQAAFCDNTATPIWTNRTNAFALDIAGLGVTGASIVPLPAAAPLLLAGLGVLGFARRRRSA